MTGNGLLGIYDFRYAPYALGDTFTWITNLQIAAHRHGATHIDMVLVTLPERPASGIQPNISRHSYVQVIDGLLPAFFCCPGTRTVTLYERKQKLLQHLGAAIAARTPSWPSTLSYLRGLLDFCSHKAINAFYFEHGWIPQLRSPPGFRQEVDAFKAAFFKGRVPFIVNIRQRALTADPQALGRDSPADVWLRFLNSAQRRWPHAVFVLVGGFAEWERDFARSENVVIPRTLGLGLGHELTMLLDGVPFIGTSSGFSAAATFSRTPYVITNFEPRAAAYVGIPPGSERYPFATQHQWLSWERETEETLTTQFERMLKHLPAAP